MTKDPYLIPGQICEVWDNRIENIHVVYFIKMHDNGFPLFSGYTRWENYHPKGTEWDFAPDWAVCSTVDKNGRILFWDTDNPSTNPGASLGRDCWGYFGRHFRVMECGICPDKSRYDGESWKTSMRMRPEWAKENS